MNLLQYIQPLSYMTGVQVICGTEEVYFEHYKPIDSKARPYIHKKVSNVSIVRGILIIEVEE
ncbi:MAG: hypothetical protein PHY47_20065 [Lachnospiraceae bacterium]|nr:hypothetical protein [Lachnospiraceae bacterium]